MSKKEEFKKFVSNHPSLATLVHSGKTTWQELFETYDIYGEDNEVWNNYKQTEKTDSKTDSIKSVLGNLKNIDVDKLEDNISSLQKALGFLEEIVISRNEKKEEKITKKKKNVEIERFFDD